MKNTFTAKRIQISPMKLILRPFFLAMFAFLLGNQASSQNSVNLVVSPAVSTVQVNDVFNVSVIVDFGTGSVQGVGAFLNFDPTYLEVLSATVPPSTASAFPFVGDDFGTVAAMNASGHVDQSRLTTAPSGHPNADFTFFTVQFRAIALPPGGNTPLTFNTTGIRTSAAGEGAQTDILDQTINGVVNINPIAGCTLAGASISNTATCNGQNFNLVLSSVTGGISPFSVVVNGITYPGATVGNPFATITLPSYNIFNITPPGNREEDNPLELGTRFTSSVAGYVKGVRFFSDNDVDGAGVYTGTLRMADGTLLASAVYTQPVPNSSWSEVLFSSPVEIAANTTYIVTYHTTSNGHAEIGGGALTNPVNNPPSTLTTLAQGGVFRYGPFTTAGGGFATNATNYLADVVFTPSFSSYAFTSITDAGACSVTGSPIQTLNVTSVNCGALPITLLRLSASPENKNITLNWATATEIDNKGFEIQRSTDNTSWEGITFVPGAGNSTSIQSYSYIDKNLFPSRYFYRLKQVDIDGKYKYSSIVAASINGKADFSLAQNYPNPFKGQTTIQYTLANVSKVNLTIFDLNGRAMKVLVNGTQDAGTHAEYFYTGSLPSGVYYYRLQAGTFTGVKKLVIQ